MKTARTGLTRLLSTGLAVLLLLSMLPLAAMAADTTADSENGLKSAVESDGTVTLTGSVTLTSPLEIAKKVTIDLGNYDLDTNFDHVDGIIAAIVVKDGGSLTLTGSGTVKGPSASLDAEKSQTYAIALCPDGSKLVLKDNVTVSGGDYGLAACVDAESRVINGNGSISIQPGDKSITVSGSKGAIRLGGSTLFSDIVGGNVQVMSGGQSVELSSAPDSSVGTYTFQPKKEEPSAPPSEEPTDPPPTEEPTDPPPTEEPTDPPTIDPPAVPTKLTWIGTTASWNGSSTAEEYVVQLFFSGTGEANMVHEDTVTGVSNCSYDFGDYITDNGIYTFKVTARNAGGPSDPAGPSPEYDHLRPTCSSRPSARSSTSTVTVYFTPSEDAKYYFIITSIDATPSVDDVINGQNSKSGSCNGNEELSLTVSSLKDNDAKMFYLVLKDLNGNYSEKPYSIQIDEYIPTATPTPKPTPAPTATPKPTPSSYTVTLNGGTGYTVSATGGSKSPVAPGGSYSFTVSISNGYSRGADFAVKANGVTLAASNGVYTISNITANQSVTVTGVVVNQTTGTTTNVPAIPSITTTLLPSATMGEKYSQQLTATGGTPITWSYTGNLPAGVTLSNTGLLSGTPTEEGSFRFTLKASNSTGSANRQMTLVVTGAQYSLLQGANAVWAPGSDEGLSFTGSGEKEFEVRIDGSAVPETALSFSENKTSVTISPTYMETLSTGSHTVTLIYPDGNAKGKFTVKAEDQTVAPTITGQPQSTEVNEGGAVIFTVTSSGTTPLRCQWQVDKNDGAGWTDIPGAVSASYSVASAETEQDGWKYRCIVTNGAGSAESNAATLTVKDELGTVSGEKNKDKDKDKDKNKDTGSRSWASKVIVPVVLLGAVGGIGGGLYYYFRRRRFMD